MLSHNHKTQFIFVRQTLELWREIQNNIFQYCIFSLGLIVISLWIASQHDILLNAYTLTDTGQVLF
jgi:hypothetical protein